MLKGTAAFAGLAAMQSSGLADPMQAAPAAGRGKGTPANVLLVHGAWADGSSWSRVIYPGRRPGRRATSQTHQRPHQLDPVLGARADRWKAAGMTHPRTALVIDGGIAGPVAAMALQRAGIQATVYEAHPRSAEGRVMLLSRRARTAQERTE